MSKIEAIVGVGNNLSQFHRRKSSLRTLLRKTWKRVIWTSGNPKELQSMEWDSQTCFKCQDLMRRKSLSMDITCLLIMAIQRLTTTTIHNLLSVLWNLTLRILPIGQLMLYTNLKFAAFKTLSHSERLWASTAETAMFLQTWKIIKDKSSKD